MDDNKASQYKNADHAGTLENFKSFVIGGARGGGGSNYTGSYSGDVSVGSASAFLTHPAVSGRIKETSFAHHVAHGQSFICILLRTVSGLRTMRSRP